VLPRWWSQVQPWALQVTINVLRFVAHTKYSFDLWMDCDKDVITHLA
jgi:hypothetical protein